MTAVASPYALRLAATDEDLTAAQRLRYEVFVAELGGDGPLVDHLARLERDAFDPYFDHLVLVDLRRDPSGLTMSSVPTGSCRAIAALPLGSSIPRPNTT
jgi:L-ornithine Nalpha-acyltransferase